jgi:hypothetical protein
MTFNRVTPTETDTVNNVIVEVLTVTVLALSGLLSLITIASV